jgi:DNA replication protein DnaC
MAARFASRPTAAELEAERKRLEEEQARHKLQMARQCLEVQLGRRYAPERVRMKDFQIYHAGQKPVLERVEAIAATWPGPLLEGRGLIFLGPCGTGKDRLMANMLYRASRHVACRWVDGLALFAAFRGAIAEREAEDSVLRRFTAGDGYGLPPQVLAISDPVPPAGSPTDWSIGSLFRVVDGRYRALQSTWMCINAASPDDADERLSAPVFDRLQENADIIRFFWPSFRERAGKRDGGGQGS